VWDRLIRVISNLATYNNMSFFLLFFLLLNTAAGKKHNTHASRKEGMLNVHIIAHTHDDVGWLKTVDQYYMGGNLTCAGYIRGVQIILDTVIAALQRNPDRKFTYVEQAFFQRWWRQQDEGMQTIVRGLVSSGQLDFTIGGWTMADEACPYYLSMIDQLTYGHKFLKEQFDFIPRMGWQIDPFGHSSTHAGLLSAEAGFDALIIGRISNQDRSQRGASKTTEFLWKPSPSLGESANIWTSVLGYYGPPDEFCWDLNCIPGVAPLQDDPRLEDVNVEYYVDTFVNWALSEASQFQVATDVIFKAGGDFQHGSMDWWVNLDRLIHHVNADGRINVFYSTPHQYALAKLNATTIWSNTTSDFFPYESGPNEYWTGYYTSRPALKRFAYEASSFFQGVRQLDLLTGGDGSGPAQMEDSVNIMTHHDAISGTEKQHVAFDYVRRLSTAVADGERVAAQGMAALCEDSSLDVHFCPLRNESVCDWLSGTDNLTAVILYNQIAHSLPELRVALPVATPSARVLTPAGDVVDSQITFSYGMSSFPRNQTTTSDSGNLLYSLWFNAQVAPLGHAVYFVQTSPRTQPPSSSVHADGDDARGNHDIYRSPSAVASRETVTEKRPEAFSGNGSSKNHESSATADMILENSYLRVVVSGLTGHLASVTNKASGVTTNVRQEFLYYEAHGVFPDGSHDNVASGAYIFRPQSSKAIPVGSVPRLTLETGPVLQQVRQHITPWLNQTVRLGASARHVEFAWTVGPVPMEDAVGKEVIVRFVSDIVSNDTFYTDSNGREMITRVVNFRPTYNLTVTQPVAGNYYPVDAAIAIRDSTRQLTVLTDRPQGGSSLRSGEVELMLHRRLLYDDFKGVSEKLDETESIWYHNGNFCETPHRSGPGLLVSGSHFLVYLVLIFIKIYTIDVQDWK
jgi:alpha-mannosidase